ncbi:MAG: glutamate--tRNA ligase family protein [Algoriphagus sp.]|uniref:glutamate--tRNA ligase family protein n=1 Tax=Algoriphagus sp. TaxID=1872435 RepID=UPI00260C3FFD|nr:glutamate--tRNA ligase family protein [Algoriphagus sp.]MDG1276112.1 glutamate--tRNA ligase family protein [Algoriphagus sp.]
MNFNLTRFAPTPSGFLHLGNLYSFLATKVLAEKHSAKILLRIDDLDRERYREEYVQDIFETLDFLELEYDLGPRNLNEFEGNWSQTHRASLYQDALEEIREKKLVFACDCSRKKIQEMDSSGYYLGHCQDRRIPLDRKEVTWRYNALETDFVSLKSYPNQLDNSLILPSDIAFFLLRKKDHQPTYQLTSLIDDLHFGVDLIVRGQDLYSSTLAQLALAEKLSKAEFLDTTFYHHQLLKGPKKKKLSKSEGAAAIQTLRKSGKKPADIYALLGEYVGEQSIEDYPTFRNYFMNRIK